jgi:predicted RNase H-like HicB family nuclease
MTGKLPHAVVEITAGPIPNPKPNPNMKAFPYQITVSYSADEEGYVARVPALRYCLAFGETPEKAVKEVKTAAAAMLKVMEEDGKPLPAVDTTLARITALQPLLNLSAIAKATDISVQTLSSKISMAPPSALTSRPASVASSPPTVSRRHDPDRSPTSLCS